MTDYLHHHRESGINRAATRTPAESASRAAGRVAIVVALLFTVAALTAPPALAHVAGHRFETTIAGSATNALTDPTDVAVDNSSGPSAGDIYVTDPAAHRVEKFSPAGVFLLMFGDEVNATTHGDVCTASETCQAGTASSAPGGFQTPSFLAADGSTSSSAGDVYVGDSGDHLVSKFKPSGEIVSSWKSAGQDSFVAIDGLAVDPSGHLFVSFAPSFFDLLQNGAEVRNCEHAHAASAIGLAVDGSEDLYEGTAAGEVERFSKECADLGEEDAATNATGLIVNPAEPGQNDLYVDQGGTIIDHFSAACNLAEGPCEPLDSFGSGKLSAAQGIAIANSGDVYVADTGANDVAVFPDLTLPDPSLTTRTDATPTALTLNGHVDPDSAHGGTEVTACQFEYVDQSEFEAHKFAAAATAPCSSTHFSTPTDVEAAITGLTPEITYHYRLSASNSQGTAASEEQTFTSPTHVFTASFGAASSNPVNPYPLSAPSDVAVDNSSGPSAGDVYVTDTANHRIEKFSPSGEFLLMFGKDVNKHGTTEAERGDCTRTEECQSGVAGSSPGAFESPTYIAVDPSGGPSAGDVYVYDSADSTVSKFDSSGNLVSSWGDNGPQGEPSGQLKTNVLAGLGTDDVGDLWTADVHDENGGVVQAYDSSGALLPGATHSESFDTFGFDVNPTATLLYVAGDGELEIRTPGGGKPGHLPGTDPVLSVAPSGYLFLSHSEAIDEFEPLGTPSGEPFGFGDLTGPSALAIDGATDDVYVAQSGADQVSVFDAVAPGVSTAGAENQDHTKATLTGTIDPLGRGEITECRFEYVDESEFNAHEYSAAAAAPCSPAAPFPNSANSTEVSAEVSGLTAETPYHYRLLDANADGTHYGNDRTFTPHAVLEVSTEPATDFERHGATLKGSFDPDSLPTTYRFEYVEAAKYNPSASNPYGEGSSTTPAGPISSPSKQSVEQKLQGLAYQTAYHYRLVAENKYGTTYGADREFETLPAVFGLETEVATEVLPESAALRGSYEGDAEGGDTHCYFRYGSDKTYGHASEELDYGSSPGAHSVEAKVTGLTPRHTYHFALVCHNEDVGTTVGADEELETPETPTIDGLASANLTKTTADLTAEIDPQGSDTRYHFEYGTTTNYGTVIPLPAEEEADGITEELSKDHSVEVKLTGLQQGVVYHFRLIATNQYGTTTTEDQSFNFFPPHCPNETLRQETNSSFLPDCRAYELVSPSNAGSTVLEPGQAPSASFAENPARFAFFGIFGELPGSGYAPNSTGNTYVSTRTPTGWVTRYVGVRGYEHYGARRFGGEYEPSPSTLLGSSSLERFVDLLEPGEGESPLDLPFAWDAEGNPLGQWPQDAGAFPGAESTNGMFQLSPDFSHLAFSSSNVPFPTQEAVVKLKGQTVGPGSAYDYDTKTGTTELISVLPDGNPLPQAPGYSPKEPSGFIGFTGDPYNTIYLPGQPEPTAQDKPSENYPGISTDGSHILMGLPGRQVFLRGLPYEASCGEDIGACPSGPGLMQLYMRVNDAVTYDVSENQVTHEPAEVEYVGMTSTGSEVYFISEEHLTAEDPDHGGTSLYMWSAEKAEHEEPALTLVSQGNANSGLGNSANCEASWVAKCGVQAVQLGSIFDKADPSEDTGTDNTIAPENGDIYFYSPEQLDGSKGITGQMNLYDYRDEKLQYVTTVEPELQCYGEVRVQCRNAPITRFQVSPDDTHAAFVTNDQVTSYDTTDPNGPCSFMGSLNQKETPISDRCQEMYSYDPITEKIVCVSCNPTGTPPTHDVSASTQGLFMSNDGRTFFSTEEALVPKDTNEVEDVYEYVEGRPQLITTGTDSADKAGNEEGVTGFKGGLAGVSSNGINVYFSTRDTLVPQDENGQYTKFYDARTDGGFPFEKPAPPCESADACHGAGSSPPAPVATETAANLGNGDNSTPEPQSKQRKHKKRVRHERSKKHRAKHHRKGSAHS